MLTVRAVQDCLIKLFAKRCSHHISTSIKSIQISDDNLHVGKLKRIVTILIQEVRSLRRELRKCEDEDTEQWIVLETGEVEASKASEST